MTATKLSRGFDPGGKRHWARRYAAAAIHVGADPPGTMFSDSHTRDHDFDDDRKRLGVTGRTKLGADFSSIESASACRQFRHACLAVYDVAG